MVFFNYKFLSHLILFALRKAPSADSWTLRNKLCHVTIKVYRAQPLHFIHVNLIGFVLEHFSRTLLRTGKTKFHARQTRFFVKDLAKTRFIKNRLTPCGAITIVLVFRKKKKETPLRSRSVYSWPDVWWWIVFLSFSIIFTYVSKFTKMFTYRMTVMSRHWYCE